MSFPDSHQSDSHSTIAKAPSSNIFTLEIKNKNTLLDSFEMRLENGENSIYISKSIFNSSYWDIDKLMKMIPQKVEIDEKSFVLIIELQAPTIWSF